MRTIAEAVRRQILHDPVAYDALVDGVLNCRAYAKRCLEPVSAWCLKPVKLDTIVTALTRLRQTLLKEAKDQKQPPLIPDFSLSSLTLKTGLSEIAYDLTPESEALTRWVEAYPKQKDALVITIRGNHELAIIAPMMLVLDLQKAFPRRTPKGVVHGVAAITVTYPSQEYLFISGITYALIRQLALQRINLVEKCSTYSEETFFVAEDDATPALECLKPFLTSNKHPHKP